MDHNWYRGSNWSDEDKILFFQKIKRSRGNFHRAQYGRIKALYLEETEDENLVKEAIKLLELVESDWYDESQISQCYNQLARCYIKLGDYDNTKKYYEKCLESEKKIPYIKTSATSDFTVFIIQNNLNQLYEEAIERLEKSKESNELITYNDMFVYHTTKAIALFEKGDASGAIQEAQTAMELIGINKSQFKNHPDFGLVDLKNKGFLIKKLSDILNEQDTANQE